MKTIYLVRHAKSSWDDSSLHDFDRPLNERGKNDAPRMGKRLRKRNIIPDLIISSSAKRARSTARRIAEALGYPNKEIQLTDTLYYAEPEVILSVIHRLPDRYNPVMLIGHNPGLTDFVNHFLGVRIDNVPTCGVAAAQFDVRSWKEVGEVQGRFLFFDYPKQQDE